MADAVYDVVIVGGGTKSLFTAMYLTRYAGLNVAIFDARHELGGMVDSQEGDAPGFVCDSHSSNFHTYYFLPIEDDFPDFVENGGALLHYPVAFPVVRRQDQACWCVY